MLASVLGHLPVRGAGEAHPALRDGLQAGHQTLRVEWESLELVWWLSYDQLSQPHLTVVQLELLQAVEVVPAGPVRQSDGVRVQLLLVLRLEHGTLYTSPLMNEKTQSPFLVGLVRVDASKPERGDVLLVSQVVVCDPWGRRHDSEDLSAQLGRTEWELPWQPETHTYTDVMTSWSWPHYLSKYKCGILMNDESLT